MLSGRCKTEEKVRMLAFSQRFDNIAVAILRLYSALFGNLYLNFAVGDEWVVER
jgi:hypothetical protein